MQQTTTHKIFIMNHATGLMKKKKIIYLASPYGFSLQQKAGPLSELVDALNAMGLEVWEPFERNNQDDVSEDGVAYRIGQDDMSDVKNSDGIFAVVNGTPPDEGVMIELGMAIAWNKRIFLFRDDFRRCTDSGEYPLNLMIFTGLGRHDWQQSYYTNVNEISRPDKALARWAAE